MNKDLIFAQFYNEVMSTHLGEGDPDETYLEVVAEDFIARNPVAFFNEGITPKVLIKGIQDRYKKQ